MPYLLGKHKVYQLLLTMAMVAGLLFPTGGIVRAEEIDPPVAADPIVLVDPIASPEAVIENLIIRDVVTVEVQPTAEEVISATEAVCTF